MTVDLRGVLGATTRLSAIGGLSLLLLGAGVSAHAQAPSTEPAAAPALPKSAAVAPAKASMKPIRKVAASAGDASGVTTGSVAQTAAVAGAPAAAKAAGGKSTGRCTRMAFEVNDWGKDGPTRDAKNLLDGHIAKWAAEKGIKTYKTGKKTVNCRLFLDFGIADEHTCRAEAPVCW